MKCHTALAFSVLFLMFFEFLFSNKITYQLYKRIIDNICAKHTIIQRFKIVVDFCKCCVVYLICIKKQYYVFYQERVDFP